MSVSVGQVQALATKGIDGMVRDSIFEDNSYLKRLKAKQGVWAGNQMSFPFNYYNSSQTNGKFYTGAESLSLDIYDPITELSFDLKEIEETLVISGRDVALVSGKQAAVNLVEARLKGIKQAMAERMTNGIYSDGTAATGELTTAQFVGQRAFLLSSGVNYGNLLSSDVSTHVAYVASNSGTNRAITTALHQEVLGGASVGEEKPTLAIMRQGVMNNFIELLKPHQRTTRDSNLNGLGHDGNTLVYSGVDHIVDELCIANSIVFLNEKYVRLYVHPDWDMKHISKDSLETMDATMNRLHWKGAYICSALRYQGKLADITG